MHTEVDVIRLSLCSKMAQRLPSKGGFWFSGATVSTITAVLTAKVKLSLEYEVADEATMQPSTPETHTQPTTKQGQLSPISSGCLTSHVHAPALCPMSTLQLYIPCPHSSYGRCHKLWSPVKMVQSRVLQTQQMLCLLNKYVMVKLIGEREIKPL